MIINQSQVAMSSSRIYHRQQTESFSISKEEVKPTRGSFLDMLGKVNEKGDDEVTNDYAPGSIRSVSGTTDELSEEDNTKITFQTINFLLRILFYKHMGGDDMSMQDLMTQYQGMQPKMYRLNMNHTTTYYESEMTNFSTQGKVVTADGREITFGVDVSMSRSFYAANSETIESNLRYIDPLVINLDSNPTSVLDMKFEFDLDADGELDEMSYLAGGSAFLALDKNDNGEIDDGSELFGTASGDGFKDLSKYDLDGNGWIDEADDVFDKLRLWQVNQDGSRTLYSLKEKNVGALFLGNVNTTFSLTDTNNTANAVLRRSGIYLTEDGNVGTMAHVDMVS